MEPCIFDLSERFVALKNIIADSNLRHLVDITLPVYFFDCPGAKKHHHAYRHGLFQHTVEVAEVAVSMLECNTDEYTDYDMDILIVAALLHDVAKTSEYCIDDKGVITYGTFDMGHVTKSVLMMVRANTRQGLCNEGMENRIATVMLAHHGFAEWGTPKDCAVNGRNATTLQSIIHSADMVSAGK
jgi:3'-5' exoribonuclease